MVMTQPRSACDTGSAGATRNASPDPASHHPAPPHTALSDPAPTGPGPHGSAHATPIRGPLTPVELATAGILSGLAVVLGLLASVMPFFNSVFQVLAAVPVAMVAVRLRPRAAVAAVATTVLVSLAIGGLQTALVVTQSALVGAIVGVLHRRGARRATVALVGLCLGALIGALTDLALWLLTDLRELMLESVRVSATGYLDLVGRWDALAPTTAAATRLLDQVLDWWWVWIPLSAILGIILVAVLAHWIIGVVLSRLHLGSDWDPLRPALVDAQAQSARRTGSGAPTRRWRRGSASTPAAARDAAPAHPDPLPTHLRDVHFRYPGASRDALAGVDLDIGPGEFVVVAGPNGSGKSTLALLLAGAEPTRGTITRPGPLGLGREGGVALLAQRSELQMLGEDVASDVVWGMDARERAAVDVESLLDQVGLDGMGAVPTRNLSGGQLQRLALAGVLARRPHLIVSDESTAMVDAAGRRDLIALLASLPSHGTTVVHITHDASEARDADRLVRLVDGRITFDGPPAADPQAWAVSTTRGGAAPSSTAQPLRDQRDEAPGDHGPAGGRGHTADPSATWHPRPWEHVEHLWVDRVSHVYDVATPWATPVLHDISLILSQGEGVLITGRNGSGKTTLSRILTGLMAPTWGRCTLDGTPMTAKVGEVALSMQHARLQLQRPRVGADILSAARAGADLPQDRADALVRDALDEVGLDPEMAGRGVDQLSGGQMRRVALAGLLASDPTVLVLDEPLAGLDPDSRELLVEALERRRRRGLAVLVISHDVEGLGSLCQRHLQLEQGVLS